MLCLSGNAKFPKLKVQILHISADTLTDGTEIMIFKLLSLGSRCAEKGAARKDKVRSL